MIDPFNLHPEDKDKMSSPKTLETIKVSEVKDIIEKNLDKIKKRKTPTWGYNSEHINSFFYNLIVEIEEKVKEKNDS